MSKYARRPVAFSPFGQYVLVIDDSEQSQLALQDLSTNRNRRCLGLSELLLDDRHVSLTVDGQQVMLLAEDTTTFLAWDTRLHRVLRTFGRS